MVAYPYDKPGDSGREQLCLLVLVTAGVGIHHKIMSHIDQFWSPITSKNGNVLFFSPLFPEQIQQLALLVCAPELRELASQPRAIADKASVSPMRISLTLGCLCRAQTALKTEGYPNLQSLDLWEAYIKGECNSFPVAHWQRGDCPQDWEQGQLWAHPPR